MKKFVIILALIALFSGQVFAGGTGSGRRKAATVKYNNSKSYRNKHVETRISNPPRIPTQSKIIADKYSTPKNSDLVKSKNDNYSRSGKSKSSSKKINGKTKTPITNKTPKPRSKESYHPKKDEPGGDTVKIERKTTFSTKKPGILITN